MSEIVKHELINDEQFMVNLDSTEPTGYSRDSDIIPADLMFAWMSASVQKRQPGAKKLKRQFLELVQPDAKYYGLKTEEIFETYREAINEEYANYDFKTDS